MIVPSIYFLEIIPCYYKDFFLGISFRIMEREKQLSILYQKQGRATQFASKAARDKWLQNEINDLQRVLSTNLAQVILFGCKLQHLYSEIPYLTDKCKCIVESHCQTFMASFLNL